MTKTATIDAAGRIELPAEYREKHPVKPGQKVRIEEMPDGSLSLKVGWEIEDMIGILDGKGIHATIEEINEAVAEAAAGR